MLTKPELIAQTLYETEPEAHRVLDVGFAQLPNAALKGEVYGIDIADVPCPKGYKEVRVVDLNTDMIPFGGGYFDVVTMGCVLAHVANPLRTLGELHRVLKVGGVLVFSTPNPHYYWENVLNIFYHTFKGRVSRAKHIEHFYSFSRYNVRTCAERMGFTVEREVGCMFQLVKTPWKWNPTRFPGMAYEVIYVLRKTGEPKHVATLETAEGVVEVETRLGL